MALDKEIWVNDIQEMLLPDNSFLTKGTDYSAFADARTIHIPVEDGLVNVEVDRDTLPGTVTTTTEQSKEIDMHHFTTDPVRIYRPEDVELSYDKRRLVTEKIAKSLSQKIAEYALQTMGEQGEPTIYNKDPMLEQLKNAALAFDTADYPDQDRYVMMTAGDYSRLLTELSEVQTNAFLACSEMKTGVVGQIYGLNIMKRSDIGGAQGLFAWHKTQFNYALGPVEIYTQENAPEYYGTVMSASVRFGVFAPIFKMTV